MKIKELSEKYNINKWTVSDRARRIGIKPIVKGNDLIYDFTPKQVQLIVGFKKHQTVVEIEKEVEVIKIMKVETIYHIYESKLNMYPPLKEIIVLNDRYSVQYEVVFDDIIIHSVMELDTSKIVDHNYDDFYDDLLFEIKKYENIK